MRDFTVLELETKLAQVEGCLNNIAGELDSLIPRSLGPWTTTTRARVVRVVRYTQSLERLLETLAPEVLKQCRIDHEIPLLERR